MTHHFAAYFKGLATVVLGGSLSVIEILRSGSLLLTFLGAMVALLGGFWTYRTQRARSRIADVELRIKEIELRRMEQESNNPFRPAA